MSLEEQGVHTHYQDSLHRAALEAHKVVVAIEDNRSYTQIASDLGIVALNGWTPEYIDYIKRGQGLFHDE